MTLTPGDFGASFKGFLDQIVSEAPPKEDPIFYRHIAEHFGEDPSKLPIITETFSEYEHPDFHLSLEHYANDKGRTCKLLGVVVSDFAGNSLSDLANKEKSGTMRGLGATEGPVQYLNIEAGDGRIITCVKSGLYLINDGEERLVAYLHASNDRLFQKGRLEVMAPNRQHAERFLTELRRERRKDSIYRGHVISLSTTDRHSLQVVFHHLPMISRADIVLPVGLLERIERQSLGFSAHSEKLLSMGRHLKRGILLHGKPGTGKTLTAMYLAREMANRTVILLTGRSLALIEQSCALARMLQPAMVVLEDVDLVAEERTRREGGSAAPVLFELLNQMDGLQDDADIMFVLTTNRPDILEPALAARPGRIDQAFEIPIPNKESRQRLFNLYSKGLRQEINDIDKIIDRTEGASPAFIRELFRKATLFAAEGNEELIIRDEHMDEALHELTVHGGELTKSILGFQDPEK
jgi:hypothetical protein